VRGRWEGDGACRHQAGRHLRSNRILILSFLLPARHPDSLIPTLAEPKTPREPVDLRIPDNYVQATLDKQTVLPPVTLATLLDNIQWVSFLALTVTPALGIYGFATHTLQLKTFLWAVGYYFMTGMSITAGAFHLPELRRLGRPCAPRAAPPQRRPGRPQISPPRQELH
jgi:hypothetical protein